MKYINNYPERIKEYQRQKEKIQKRGLTPKEYEKRIKILAKKLNV